MVEVEHKKRKTMKKTIIFASVALATLFAFSSCQKETLQDNESTNGVRIITAEFENNATKTYLNDDGVTPEWKFGDKIMLLNNDDQQEIEIISGSGTPSDGKAYINDTGLTISTHLGNTLYAVYPATATSMESCPDGEITFTIPAVQDGTFGSANICVAKSMVDDETNKDNLVFRNATSVLEFSQTTSNGVLRVCATAANAIAGTLTATFGEDNKATVSASGLAGKTIWTTAPAEAANKYYVAVAPVETGDITFNYYKAEEEKSESKDTKTLALNKIYALTIPTEDYENSYVKIKMTVGDTEKTYKWAKCNLGAVTETEYGNYYAWGDIIGQTAATSGSGAFATAFDWAHAPFNNGSSDYDSDYFDTDKQNEVCPGGVLAKDYDVANKVLGGNWRMPTKEEFEALCSLTKEWRTDYKDSGVNGYLFTDAKGKELIFLPAAGQGSDSNLEMVGIGGNYWSSSCNALDTDYPFTAYCLQFGSFPGLYDYAGTSTISRCCGQSVRALSEL